MERYPSSCFHHPTEKFSVVYRPTGIQPNIHTRTFPGTPLTTPRMVTLLAQSLPAAHWLRTGGWCQAPPLLAGLHFPLPFEFHGSVVYGAQTKRGFYMCGPLYVDCLTDHQFRSCLSGNKSWTTWNGSILSTRSQYCYYMAFFSGAIFVLSSLWPSLHFPNTVEWLQLLPWD